MTANTVHSFQSSAKADGVAMQRGWALKEYQRGLEAAKAKVPSSANPHPRGTDQAALWDGGWQSGASER